MAIAYQPPGVNVLELFSPSVQTILGDSAQVCLVGYAQGFQVGVAQAVFDPSSTAPAVNEVQLITLTSATGGTFTLTFGANTTSALAFNASAATVQTALQGLASIGSGNATVAGSAGGPYTVTFTGAKAGASQSLIVADGTLLTGSGHAIAVTRSTAGHPAIGVQATLTAPVGAVFQKVSVSQSFVSVKNITDPTAGSGSDQSGYLETTDYVATLLSDHKTFTVVAAGALTLETNGGVLALVYHYVPELYYTATRLDNQSAVEDRYGVAYDETGIVTPLSVAAGLSFENGAQSVVIQPLFKLTTPSDPASIRLQPSVAESSTQGIWQQSLYGLRDIEDVNIITPIIGQLSTVNDDAVKNVLFATQDHVQYMGTQGTLMINVIGEDSSNDITQATATTLRSHATQLADRYGGDIAERTVFVSPSRFKKSLPSALGSVLVGGQYAAAAIGGMIAARSVITPLTRRALAGFTEVSDARDQAAKNADAAAGLLVIESKSGVIQVRHGITLDSSTTARKELSVVRAKHFMISALRNTIDEQIIGNVPADGNAPLVVKNAVIGVLESLRAQRNLVDYGNVTARTLTGDPATVECRFSYLPAFPLNYVNIVFSIDLTGSTITEVTTL